MSCPGRALDRREASLRGDAFFVQLAVKYNRRKEKGAPEARLFFEGPRAAG
jgi:hypothetical protein